jgi:hypothetical protein
LRSRPLKRRTTSEAQRSATQAAGGARQFVPDGPYPKRHGRRASGGARARGRPGDGHGRVVAGVVDDPPCRRAGDQRPGCDTWPRFMPPSAQPWLPLWAETTSMRGSTSVGTTPPIRPHSGAIVTPTGLGHFCGGYNGAGRFPLGGPRRTASDSSPVTPPPGEKGRGVVGSEGFERDTHASQWPLRTWGTSNSRPGRRTSPGTHTRRPRTFRRGSARAERGQVKRPVQMKSGVAMGVEPVARPHASGPELLCARGRDAIAARSMRGSGLDVIPIAARTMLAGAIRLRSMMRGVDGDDAPLRTRGAVGRRAALPAGSWCEITATTAAVSYEPVLSRAWLIVRKPYRPGHDPGACSCASNQCAPSDRTPDWRPEGLRPLRASPRLGALWSAGHAR